MPENAKNQNVQYVKIFNILIGPHNIFFIDL